MEQRDGDAGAAGVVLRLGGSPGCAGSGWMKEEEKKEKVHKGKFFFLPLFFSFSQPL